MAVEIQIMIPQYGELNRIYSDFIISHTFSFDKQKFITDFYKQYNDTKPVGGIKIIDKFI